MGQDEACFDVSSQVRDLALRAKRASAALAQASARQRDDALSAMASALRLRTPAIVEANGQDMDAARVAGTTEALLDRLMLNDERVEAMAAALEALRDLPDPLGRIQMKSTLYNGIELSRVSVPLGVVAMIYEARPNVTADAAGICMKSGNAVVLRGGSLAARSTQAIADALRRAVADTGLPADAVCAIESTDRAATDALMQLHGVVDVLVPRGGAGLIRHCVENSKVPVIETGTGNCHVYVHESADLSMARAIVMNAKCRRYGVCNAAETLLVDRRVARCFLPEMLSDLSHAGVLIHGDEESARCVAWAKDTGGRAGVDIRFEAATEQDWATEYLAPEIAVKCVDGFDEAIEHVNRYGTKHSEAIVADESTEEGAAAIEAFLSRVDAAAVYANASTAFTDGGQFGLGAEIGISTQKLHARGPFALEALTSYKYVLRGSGQVRA